MSNAEIKMTCCLILLVLFFVNLAIKDEDARQMLVAIVGGAVMFGLVFVGYYYFG